MTLRIAVNGCGRIGRNIIRAQMESPRKDIDIVMVNDLADVATTSHLLCFDTIHGRSKQVITHDGQDLYLAGKKVLYRSQPDPRKLDYVENEIDLVLECTGRFVSGPDAQAHIEAGAKRVLISAPGKQVDRTIVYGVNHETVQGSDKIISNASCTTNALAPLVKLLDDTWGLRTGWMTTIHCYTGSQPSIDAPRGDFLRSRAAALSMVPTTTSAQRLLNQVLPDIAGRIEAAAVRVPAASVSAVDLAVTLDRAVTLEEVHALIRGQSGIIGWTDKPLVSSDLRARSESLIVSLPETRVTEGGLVRVFGWYDNEWGFSCRMLDVAQMMTG